MSNAMQNLCRPVQLPPTEKAVLMCLADAASDNGHCFMLVSTLELYCCLAERTVRKAIASLSGRGYVRAELRSGRSSVYWLIPEAIDAGIDPKHRRSLTPASQAPPTPAPDAPTPARGAPTPARGAPTPARGAPITMSDPCLNRNLTETVRVSETTDDFDVVWRAYPRKTCKAEARNVWKRLGGGEALAKRMLAWVAAQKQTEQWQRGIVPHLRTVLHQRRFEDPLPSEVAAENTALAHSCRVCGARATVTFENERFCRTHNPARL